MVPTIDVILDGARSGEENMALDRQALAHADEGQSSLRLYSWLEPTVTLGKSQSPADVSSLFPSLPTVSRPTGGGAVLHGWDVTIAATIPLDILGLPARRLRAIYGALVQPLAESLTECGLPCTLAGSGVDRVPDCFASVGAMDLIGADRRKVAGCAMAVSRTAALLHVSIPSRPIPLLPGVAAETIKRYINPPWESARFPSVFCETWQKQFGDATMGLFR